MQGQDAAGGPKVKRSEIVYRNMRDSELLKRYYSTKTVKIGSNMEISGDSPTDIFIGRFGYPKVFIGPLVPPVFGNTEVLATPEMWRTRLHTEDLRDEEHSCAGSLPDKRQEC